MLAKHIPDGASICINLGTTTEEVAYALLGHNNLRVLTNNLNVAAIMARNPNFDVVVAGGTVRHHDHGIIGPSAENFIRESPASTRKATCWTSITGRSRWPGPSSNARAGSS